MNEHGMLVVVSGFSGAGKGTIIKSLTEQYGNYALSISATTRTPRVGEAHGREYFFVSEKRFLEMIRNEDLIEYAQYVNHYYGTPRDYVEEQMEQGKDVLLEIEIQGALKIKERFAHAILIFVTPPDVEELKRRLMGRGTESGEVIRERLHRAAEEAEGIEAYDYLLINDEVADCTRRLHEIIRVQHQRISSNGLFLSQIREELKRL